MNEECLIWLWKFSMISHLYSIPFLAETRWLIAAQCRVTLDASWSTIVRLSPVSWVPMLINSYYYYFLALLPSVHMNQDIRRRQARFYDFLQVGILIQQPLFLTSWIGTHGENQYQNNMLHRKSKFIDEIRRRLFISREDTCCTESPLASNADNSGTFIFRLWFASRVLLWDGQSGHNTSKGHWINST